MRLKEYRPAPHSLVPELRRDRGSIRVLLGPDIGHFRAAEIHRRHPGTPFCGLCPDDGLSTLNNADVRTRFVALYLVDSS
jgi:hypothetical protein